MVLVVFRNRLHPGFDTEYNELAGRMYRLASAQPGFISEKTFVAEDGERVSVQEWEDIDRIRAWGEHPEHLAAQKLGRERYYSEYSLELSAPKRAVQLDPKRVDELSRVASDLRPVIMVNLLRYRDQAAYSEDSDAEPCTGREAYGRYGAVTGQLIGQHGGRPVWVGQARLAALAPSDEEWDDVILVEYPSVADFRAMVESPAYKAVAKHRTAALSDSRLFACEALFDHSTMMDNANTIQEPDS